jgi:hypothetical protein
MSILPRVALIASVVGACVIVLITTLAGGLGGEVENTAPNIRQLSLAAVSNASGLVVIERDGQRLVATVDEVSEWTRSEDPPPLITWSSITDGSMQGGEGHVAQYGEVEALSLIDGRVVFPYKTDAQTVVLRDGYQVIPLINPSTIKKLRDAAEKVASGPL